MGVKCRFGSSEAIAGSYDEALCELGRWIDLHQERGDKYNGGQYEKVRDGIQAFDVRDLAELPNILDIIDGFTRRLPGVVHLDFGRQEVMNFAQIESLLEEKTTPPYVEHFVPVDRLMTAVDFIVTAMDIRNTATRFTNVFKGLGSLQGVLYELDSHVGNVDVRGFNASKLLNCIVQDHITQVVQQIVGQDSGLDIRASILTYQTSRDLPDGLSKDELTRRLQAPCWYINANRSRRPYTDEEDFEHLRDSTANAGLQDVLVRDESGEGRFTMTVPISNASVLFTPKLAEKGVEMSPVEAERAAVWRQPRSERLCHAIATYRENVASQVEAVGGVA